MSDLRHVLERGTEGFDPEAEGALERTLRRAARRSRNRRIAAASVALTLTVGVVAVLWAAWFGGQREQLLTPAVKPVEVARIPLGVGPIEGRPVFGEGRLWVGAGGYLNAIEPDTHEVVLAAEGIYPPLVVSHGSVWGGVPGQPPKVLRVDPTSGAVDATIDVAPHLYTGDPGGWPGHWPLGMGFVGDLLHVALPGTDQIIRFDPDREGSIHHIPVTSEAGALIEMWTDGEAVWARHERGISIVTESIQETGYFPDRGVVSLATRGPKGWVILADGHVMARPARGPDSGGVEIGEFQLQERRTVDAVVLENILWVLSESDDEGGLLLKAYDLATGRPVEPFLRLPVEGRQSESRLASGRGFLWVTDPAGGAIIVVDPYGTTSPDPEPALTEEREPEAGCPPPELEPTWFPPGLSLTTPQPGLGGGMGGTETFPSAVHYGDSPGPDGGPAPFINVLVWTADDHEVGPPHIWPMDAREFGTPIEVIGAEGHLVRIEGGWGAIFTDGDPPCNGYEVTAYGVSRGDLRRFLEGVVRPSPGPLLVEPRDG